MNEIRRKGSKFTNFRISQQLTPYHDPTFHEPHNGDYNVRRTSPTWDEHFDVIRKPDLTCKKLYEFELTTSTPIPRPSKRKKKQPSKWISNFICTLLLLLVNHIDKNNMTKNAKEIQELKSITLLSEGQLHSTQKVFTPKTVTYVGLGTDSLIISTSKSQTFVYNNSKGNSLQVVTTW